MQNLEFTQGVDNPTAQNKFIYEYCLKKYNEGFALGIAAAACPALAGNYSGKPGRGAERPDLINAENPSPSPEISGSGTPTDATVSTVSFIKGE